MAYDDSRFRGEPGFHEEPDFRLGVPEDAPTLGVGQSAYSAGGYPATDYASPAESTVGLGGRRGTPSTAQLGDVFDDPEHGEPGRDRMAVHALWETVLLLATASLVYLLRDSAPAALRGSGLRDLMLLATEIGLVALGMGLSLRTGAVNLALGPIAYASALYFADNSDRGLLMTAGITVGVAVVLGVVLAIMVAGFHVPSWAASLALALGLIVWIQDRSEVRVVDGAYDPHGHAVYWMLLFMALGIIGAMLGMLRPIRRGVGRFRPVSDPARRRGGAAAMLASLALVGSSLLAAAAGVLLALDERTVGGGEEGLGLTGLALTGLALGAALLGGTSAFGRRGGLFGTVIAVALVVLVIRYAAAERWQLSWLAIGAGAIAAGLVVTRLVETFGRPKSAVDQQEEEGEWGTGSGSADSGWSTTRTGGWTSQLPARATDEPWGPDRWGSR